MSLLVDIRKNFGDFSLEAFFEVKNREFIGLLGASGSGKSVTLKCISGVETPDEGKIILNGETLFDSSRKINVPPRKRKIGYLLQNYGLFPNMTVAQNIACGVQKEKKKGLSQPVFCKRLIWKFVRICTLIKFREGSSKERLLPEFWPPSPGCSFWISLSLPWIVI